MSDIDLKVIKRKYDLQGDQWTIYFYKIYDVILFEEKNISELELLLKFSKEQKNSFKWPLNLPAFQFLCAINPDKKIIRIGSKNLSHELNLIDIHEHLGRFDEVSELKIHAEEIAMIPLENSPLVLDYISFKYDLPDFTDKKFKKVLNTSNEKSTTLKDHLNKYKQSYFEKLSDKGLDLTANYELIRVHLLKFLAILPCLEHDRKGDEVKRVFIESLKRLLNDNQVAQEKKLKGQKRHLPNFYVYVFRLTVLITSILNAKLLAYVIRKSVAFLAKRFIAGESIEKAQGQLSSLLRSNRDATLDQLGELVVSNKEADLYKARVIEIIKGLNKHIAKGEKNTAGINKAHISIKVTALCNDFKTYAFDYVYEQVAPRLKEILLRAKEEKVFINIDAEHYHVRDQVFNIYKKVLLETEELKDYEATGIVVQAYLRDAYQHFIEIISLAKQRGIPMPIRLVKGAYWDAETIEAQAHNHEAFQFLNKEETDIYFRQLAYKALEASDYIKLAIASHNIQDHCFVESLRSEMFPNAYIIEHQCLHMTYEALSCGLSKMNWPTRNYIPIGDLLIGMAYLVRRIMENSSQVGILTIMRSHKKATTFADPSELISLKKENRDLTFDSSLKHLSREFKNIYPLKLFKQDELDLLLKEIKESVQNFQNKVIGHNENMLVSYCPSLPSLKLSAFMQDNNNSLNEKINKLHKGFLEGSWRFNKKSNRFFALTNLSNLLLINRVKLSTLIMIEAGKTIDEALLDVDEAIDFIDFYLREEVNIIKKFGYFDSRGVFAIIAPWNFPLAIPCGMAVAALCAGNTVLLKPSEHTPMIINEFLKLVRQSGIDSDVFDVAFGSSTVGQFMVDHELISGVVFTGSQSVGEQIFRTVSSKFLHPSYMRESESKTVITEMGGKNAIIITNNCELDETVSGVIYSAFAHSGQKCSACSRIIIDEKIKNAFLDRFIDAIRDLSVSDSLDLKATINPLISEKDKIRIKRIAKEIYKEIENNRGIVHIDRTSEEYDAHCVAPLLVEVNDDIAFDKNSYACREIFGPIIHLITYKTLDDALKIFNATDYALTGGIYAQSQNDIDYLSSKMLAGNLYINRPNTGARVAIEPFGGFRMSGTGPKAGGKSYIKSFHVLAKKKKEDFKSFKNNIKLSQTFTLSRPSKISPFYRLKKIKKYLETVLNRYEIFFQGIDERSKDVILSLIDYIDKGYARLDLRKFPNREIPGQLSYDKRDLALGTGILILGEDKIELQQFLTFIFNLIIGNGTTIVCTNTNGFRAWLKLINSAYISGLSTYNVNGFALDSKGLLNALKEETYNFVYVDKHIDELEDVLKTVSSNKNSIGLVKVLLSEEWEDWSQFDSFIENLTHSRSFAINIMRHGAPLEITLN